MGILIEDFKREFDFYLKHKIKIKEIDLLELGNQYIKGIDCPAKEQYSKLIKSHTSIDLNGQDGALKIDLCQALPKNFVGRFDVVTNYGTSEHVDSQYMVFKNIHDACKKGGIMIHMLSLKGYWKFHSRFLYFPVFAVKLARENNYKIMYFETLEVGKDKYQLVYFKKLKDDPFCRFISFSDELIEDTGYYLKNGNYTSLFNRIKRKILDFRNSGVND